MADELKASPQEPITGALSKALEFMAHPTVDGQEIKPRGFNFANLLPLESGAKFFENRSYGKPLFTGAGGLGGTSNLAPDVRDFALDVAPYAPNLARVIGKTAKVVGKNLGEAMSQFGPSSGGLKSISSQLGAIEPNVDLSKLRPSELDAYENAVQQVKESGSIPRTMQDVVNATGNESDIAKSLMTSNVYKALKEIPISAMEETLARRKMYRSEPRVTPGPKGSEKEWADWGAKHGVNMTVTPDVPLGISDLTTGREIKLPGGLEGTFTIPDLFKIKAQNIDPNALPKDVHDALMEKFIRTHKIDNPDQVDMFNRLNFALLSPNAPLTPNEFLAQRARLVNMDELKALASRAGEPNLSKTADVQLGVGAAGRGGMGVLGTADLGNQAVLAKLILQKPEMFQLQPGETMRDVTTRVMNQVPGLGPKTASLGTPWLDLAKANTSAVDLHMINNSYKRMLDDPDVGQAFRERMAALLKTKPTTEDILKVDPKLVKDAAINVIGGTQQSRMYRLKSGELNNIPSVASPEKLAYEPKVFQEFNPFYSKVVDYVDESRGQHPILELFPEQWRKWDQYRGRIEPHEFAHPDFRKLPRQSWSEMADSLQAHKNAGYTQSNTPVMKEGDWRELYYGGGLPLSLVGTQQALQEPQKKAKGGSIQMSDNPDTQWAETAFKPKHFADGGINTSTGLLSGVLPAIYSAGDTAKRYMKSFASDPMAYLQQGLGQANDTSREVLNLMKQAHGDPQHPTRVTDPQALQALTDMGVNQMLNFGGAGVIKPKGGNWLTNSIENNLKGLKTFDVIDNVKHFHGPELEKLRKNKIEELIQIGDPHSLQEAERHKAMSEFDKPASAINQWIDKNLTNYVKNQMGTPEDPIRLMIDSRVEEIKAKHKKDMARADKLAQRASEETDPRRQANLQREADRLRTEAENEKELSTKHVAHVPLDEQREDIDNLIDSQTRSQEGFPAEGMGKSAQAKSWENISDEAIYPKKAKVIQEAPERIAQLEQAKQEKLKAHDELNQKLIQHIRDKGLNLSPEQENNFVSGMSYKDKEQIIGDDTLSKALDKEYNLYSHDLDYNKKLFEENPFVNKLDPNTSIYSAQTGGLGFDHVLDVLKENLATGRLKPEELKNISVEQAVRKTADYDLTLAKKMQEAQAKKLDEMTLHKEYPNGMKWVQLDQPGQFAAESQAMGHSVKGYEPPKNHPDWIPESGDSGSLSYGHGGWEGIKSGKAKIYSLVDPKGNPHTTVEVKASPTLTPEKREAQMGFLVQRLLGEGMPEEKAIEQANKLYPISETNPSITQIKGKSNRAPNEQYLPFIQDFVKSGNWSDVRDLHNTDLTQIHPESDLAKSLAQKGMNVPSYATSEELTNLLKQAKVGYYQDASRGTTYINVEHPDFRNDVPPVEGMKKGGKVYISDNPDMQWAELQFKRK